MLKKATWLGRYLIQQSRIGNEKSMLGLGISSNNQAYLEGL